MTSPQFVHGADGQEVAEEDMNYVASAAAHADDALLAELLKLAPFDGTNYAKAILPYQQPGVNQALLAPGPGGGIITIWVAPFRAIIGTRVAQNGTPNPIVTPIMASANEQNYRDIRSAVFAQGGVSSGLSYVIPSSSFVSNSSGNPRWDMVYAQVYVDQGTNVTRWVKPPGITQGGVQSVAADYYTIVNAILVATGTPAASPVLPTVSDTPASGIFNIPLGYILIPNGFVSGSSSMVTTKIHTAAPCVSIAEKMGGYSLAPAGFTSSSTLVPGTWSSGTRPVFALPTTMRGGSSIFVPFDRSDFSDGYILDRSVDWRNRLFRVYVCAITGTSYFPWDPSAVAGSMVPDAINSPAAGAVAHLWTPGQSFVDTSNAFFGSPVSGGGAVIFYADNTTAFTSNTLSAGAVTAITPIVGGGKSIGLYVHLGTGQLRIHVAGSWDAKFFAWVDATAPMDNR